MVAKCRGCGATIIWVEEQGQQIAYQKHLENGKHWAKVKLSTGFPDTNGNRSESGKGRSGRRGLPPHKADALAALKLQGYKEREVKALVQQSKAKDVEGVVRDVWAAREKEL